jgi:hypothetical protein
MLPLGKSFSFELQIKCLAVQQSCPGGVAQWTSHPTQEENIWVHTPLGALGKKLMSLAWNW